KSQDKNKVSEIDDQIYRHFDIKKRLGKGAYGIVWKAIDRKSSNIVAVKKIFDAFRNKTDAQRTFREIMFLKAFKNHPNVIQLYSIHKATNNLDIYLAFEYMESDLHNVIKGGTILKDIHKRYVMYQLFNAIKYIHSGNVIHRDLKPSNVLIDSKCRCKIADFGLARSVSNRPMGETNTSVDPTEPILTDYVATRWYRAPEILIASKRYTKGIDMWSLGCILGEMIRGKPLFPGSSTVNQIEKIVAALPEINEKDIEAVGAGFGSVLLNQQISSENNLSIDELLAGSSEDAKNLVKLLLMLNPAQRLTAKEALSHRYIEKFKNSITETELSTDVLPPFRDDVQLTVPEYRSKLYEIMQISEVKGNEKNSNNSVKNTTKLNSTAKRKDIATPKLESTMNVSHQSSKQTSVKISPSKSDEKSKKEYNHNRFTEKKYQQNSITTHHNIANNNTNNWRKQFILYKEKEAAATISNKTNIHNNSNSSNISNSNENGNSRFRNVNQYEKRHSIDCTYHVQGISPNSTFNKTPYNNRLSIDKEKPELIEISKNNQIYQSFKKTPELDHLINTRNSNSDISTTLNTITNDSMDNNNYYEKRLKLLEEKIQKQKLDIKALFNEKDKCSRIPNILENNSSDNRSLRSKFTIPQEKNYSKRNNHIIGHRSGQIPIKYDFGHPDDKTLDRIKVEYTVIQMTNSGFYNNIRTV
ncbi:extracellular signal-regulated kinase 2, partial [Condylostylus longicornis]|uniref:extracellular signal-regulated kinase 2 n=1 Tax=Condylostylus longicornis TaxID=2530218 RepID=UPI00244DA354